jgi:hypothetical protein
MEMKLPMTLKKIVCRRLHVIIKKEQDLSATLSDSVLSGCGLSLIGLSQRSQPRQSFGLLREDLPGVITRTIVNNNKLGYGPIDRLCLEPSQLTS